MCSFFSIGAASLSLLVLLSVDAAAGQDWRTSGEDPCACTDSMPFIIGPRPPVGTAAEIAAMVRDSANPSCRTARVAIEALRNAPPDAAVTQALVARLSSPSCAVRASAAWSLIRHQGASIAPALLRALDDEDRRVRQAAAYALGRHGDDRAVQPLITLLAESNKHVKQSAAESLGRIGNPAAREPLTRLLDDPEPHVRDAAKKALARLWP